MRLLFASCFSYYSLLFSRCGLAPVPGRSIIGKRHAHNLSFSYHRQFTPLYPIDLQLLLLITFSAALNFLYCNICLFTTLWIQARRHATWQGATMALWSPSKTGSDSFRYIEHEQWSWARKWTCCELLKLHVMLALPIFTIFERHRMIVIINFYFLFYLFVSLVKILLSQKNYPFVVLVLDAAIARETVFRFCFLLAAVGNRQFCIFNIYIFKPSVLLTNRFINLFIFVFIIWLVIL